MNYDMGKFGKSITNEIIAQKICKDLELQLEKNDMLILDFKNIDILTTTCVKGIFKSISEKMNSSDFFKRFAFINVSNDLKVIITYGLEDLY